MSIGERRVMSWDSAVIFAGGKSSRMGQDKALLPFGGFDSLAEYQYQRLRKYFDKVYISAKRDKFYFDAPIIHDLYPQSSPMVALVSSLEQIESPEIFIISVDMPFVDKELISKLYKTFKSDPETEIIIAASDRGNEPLCGIYRRPVLERARSLVNKDKHRMKYLIEMCETKVVKCNRDMVFVNLNTPEDYSKYTDLSIY